MTKLEKCAFWSLVVILIGFLAILSLLRYQDKRQIDDLSDRVTTVEGENKQLAREYYDLYTAIMPTHKLMLVDAKGRE